MRQGFRSHERRVVVDNPLRQIVGTPAQPVREDPHRGSPPSSISSSESVSGALSSASRGRTDSSVTSASEQADLASASRALFVLPASKGASTSVTDVEAGGESKEALEERSEGLNMSRASATFEVARAPVGKNKSRGRLCCGYIGFLLFASYQSLSVALGAGGKALWFIDTLFYPLVGLLAIKTEQAELSLAYKLQTSALCVYALTAILNFLMRVVFSKDAQIKCLPIMQYNFAINRIKFLFGGVGLANFSMFIAKQISPKFNPLMQEFKPALAMSLIGIAMFFGAVISMVVSPNDLTRRPLKSGSFPTKQYKGRVDFVCSNSINVIFAVLRAADISYVWDIWYLFITVNNPIQMTKPQLMMKSILLLSVSLFAGIVGCLRNKFPVFYHRVEQAHRLIVDIAVFLVLVQTVTSLMKNGPSSPIFYNSLTAACTLFGAMLSGYSVYHHNSRLGRAVPIRRARTLSNISLFMRERRAASSSQPESLAPSSSV